MKKVLSIVLCSFVFVATFFMTSCGKSDKSMKEECKISAAADTALNNEAKTETVKEDTNSKKSRGNEKQNAVEDTQRKLIKRYEMSLETKNFDESFNNIMKNVDKYGGYVEGSNLLGNKDNGNRRIELSVRIPKDKAEKFFYESQGLATVVGSSINVEDVTSSYFDSEARLKSLKIQEERLLELMKKSDDIKGLIELEKSLSEVRYQIETLTGTLKRYDNLIDYSSININMIEVVYVKSINKGFSNRVYNIFIGSLRSIKTLCENIVLFIVAIAPYLVLLIIILLILKYIFKVNIKFPKCKKPKKIE